MVIIVVIVISVVVVIVMVIIVVIVIVIVAKATLSKHKMQSPRRRALPDGMLCSQSYRAAPGDKAQT